MTKKLINSFKDIVTRAEANSNIYISKEDLFTLRKVYNQITKKPLSKGRKLFDYPFSILYDANYNVSDEFKPNISVDQFENIVKSYFTPSEIIILDLFYKEKLTLIECGERLGISRQRIDQRRVKILKKFQLANIKSFILDYDGSVEVNELASDIKSLKNRQLEAKQTLMNNISIINKHIDNTDEVIQNSIPEMININKVIHMNGSTSEVLDEDLLKLRRQGILSQRAFSSLRRSGYNNLRELDGISYETLSNIRNIGQKTLNEIISVLKLNNIKLSYI